MGEIWAVRLEQTDRQTDKQTDMFSIIMYNSLAKGQKNCLVGGGGDFGRVFGAKKLKKWVFLPESRPFFG